jgi:hypothetical protein
MGKIMNKKFLFMLRFEKRNINKNKIKSKDKRMVRLTAGIKKIIRKINRLGFSK